MNTLHRLLTLTLLLTTSPFLAAQTCDRDCLEERLDQYLNAITHNDPAIAPLAIGFRQTENAVVKKIGDGMWASATGLGEVQRRFLDPVTGQAAYFGFLKEGENTAVVVARILVEADQITEAEWYIGRQGDPGTYGPASVEGGGNNLYDLEYLTNNPPPERVVPVNQRLDRAALIRITNSYFDGITSHDGSIIQAHPGCLRVENGFRTTQRPFPDSWQNPHNKDVTDCTDGMTTFGISLVSNRRYVLVDEQAQLVMGLAVFMREPGHKRRRNSFAELFFIDEGRISKIYAAMFYPAPGQPLPNWPPYHGNFPLSGSLLEEVK